MSRSVSIATSSSDIELPTSIDQYLTGESDGIFVALGVPTSTNPQRFDLEDRVIKSAVRGRRTPETHSLVTPGELQGLALRRPFILHLAAHQEMGAVMLGSRRGEPVPVLLDDLVRLISPSEGGPAAVVLSFCDSHQVAARLRDQDMAVISFEGELSDPAAFAFNEHLYDAIALGRTISMSFEVGKAAVRGAHGVDPRLSQYSSAHGRSLPL